MQISCYKKMRKFALIIIKPEYNKIYFKTAYIKFQ